MLIDCHAHLSANAFDADRLAVRRRARAAGVAAILVVGEDADDNRQVAELCEETCEEGAALLPCFGLHPDRFADDRDAPSRAQIDETVELIRGRAPDLAAIGEVGLDRWWVKNPERRRAQASLLEELAELASELDLALNVHSRSAGHYAIDLLQRVRPPRVLMHAFDGKASHAVRGAEGGFVFSIPPSIVRSEQKQKLVRRLPLESLALESDAPVLGPAQSERNEPANVTRARDFIARAHGTDADRVSEITARNAGWLFPGVKGAVGARRRQLPR